MWECEKWDGNVVAENQRRKAGNQDGHLSIGVENYIE